MREMGLVGRWAPDKQTDLCGTCFRTRWRAPYRPPRRRTRPLLSESVSTSTVLSSQAYCLRPGCGTWPPPSMSAGESLISSRSSMGKTCLFFLFHYLSGGGRSDSYLCMVRQSTANRAAPPPSLVYLCTTRIRKRLLKKKKKSSKANTGVPS